ncbi:SRPBCC domain-containing protein [Kocuria sp. NPDC057446]|uniref:SRPBCC family protein n=1 Tax=Kocuria sp. NPDC057446 TaxID=3346137 RepID=UPI00369E02E4
MDVTDLDPAEVLSVSHPLAHPPAAVFAAFTEPDRLAAWFGPPGWSVPRESVLLEVRAGGRQQFRLVQDADPAQVAPVHGTYSRVEPGVLLEGREALPGPDGEPTASHVLTRTEFVATGDGGTLLVLTQGPLPPAVHPGAAAAWRGSFSRLEALLATG